MTLPPSRIPKAGDLLFFRGDHPHNSLAERVIMKRTGSIYVHVGIAVEHSLMTSARSDGIRTQTLPSPAALHLATGNLCRSLDDGLSWLACKVGQPYGFGDIFNQLLTMIHAPFDIKFIRAWDCSDLAVRFLNAADFSWPDAGSRIQVPDSDLVTPASLAQSLISLAS